MKKIILGGIVLVAATAAFAHNLQSKVQFNEERRIGQVSPHFPKACSMTYLADKFQGDADKKNLTIEDISKSHEFCARMIRLQTALELETRQRSLDKKDRHSTKGE